MRWGGCWREARQSLVRRIPRRNRTPAGGVYVVPQGGEGGGGGDALQGELGVVADIAIFVVKGLSQRRDRGGGGVADFGEGEGGVAAGGLVVVAEDGG